MSRNAVRKLPPAAAVSRLTRRNFLTIVRTDDGRTDGLGDDRLVDYYVIVCEVTRDKRR